MPTPVSALTPIFAPKKPLSAVNVGVTLTPTLSALRGSVMIRLAVQGEAYATPEIVSQNGGSLLLEQGPVRNSDGGSPGPAIRVGVLRTGMATN